MRARTDLWEPGASNRLGPPGQRRISRKSRSEERLDQRGMARGVIIFLHNGKR